MKPSIHIAAAYAGILLIAAAFGVGDRLDNRANVALVLVAIGVALVVSLIQRLKGDEAVSDMRARKDAAYEERNRVVAALARVAVQLGYPVGLARTNIEGWNDAWHNCVYIDLPQGQVSWHFHDDHAHLFAGLPAYMGTYDGHSTPEKYDRLGRYAQVPWTTDAAGKVEPVRCGDVLRQDGEPVFIDLIDHDRIPGIGSAADLAREEDDGARQMEQDAAREGELLAEAGFTTENAAGEVVPVPSNPDGSIPLLSALEAAELPATCGRCKAITALKDGLCRSCRQLTPAVA